MIKNIIYYYIFFISTIYCQNNNIYFQQNVDYNIHVSLNGSSHILSGNETINYTNNSPDTLYLDASLA